MVNKRKTIIFAAGGTGGHIFPAMTVARKFTEMTNDYDVLFIGGGGELEKRLMGKSEFDYEFIKSSGVVGKGVGALLTMAKNLIIGIFKLRKLYTQRNAVLVIGFGGYPSVIPVLAAAVKRLPIFLFEQNGISGVANRNLSHIATKIFTVPVSKNIPNGIKKDKNAKTVLNPVRPEIKTAKPWQISENSQPLRILVIGGSQGAKTLNESILGLREFFIEHSIKLVQQTGSADFQRIQTAYQGESTLNAIEFIDEMQSVLSNTDLVICRSGAGTVSEITHLKIPTIFVPLPISNGHQKFNIMHLVEGNAAKMFPQDDKLTEKLKDFILKVIENRKILEEMNKSFSTIPELAEIEDGALVISKEIYSQVSKMNGN